MSFADFLSKIPRLTAGQRRELLRHLRNAGATRSRVAPASFCARQIDGRVVLVAPRTIRQAEVDAILEELP